MNRKNPGRSQAPTKTGPKRGVPQSSFPLEVWPQASFALALLHFTGSGHFNREMRLYAKRNGYHLSDHELRRLADGYTPPLASDFPL